MKANDSKPKGLLLTFAYKGNTMLQNLSSEATWLESPSVPRRRELNESGKSLAESAKAALGEWLSQPKWDWYTTHTFRNDKDSQSSFVSAKRADKAWYSWFNSLRLSAEIARQAPSIYGVGSPFYFRVAEYQDRGTLHYHALIGGVGDIRRLTYKDLWELWGFARVLPYEVGRGANFYVGKYLTKSQGDIRFSHNLTPYLTLGKS